jgi:hypothetical protein
MGVYKKLATLNPENIPVNVISVDILWYIDNIFFQVRHPTPIGVKHPVECTPFTNFILIRQAELVWQPTQLDLISHKWKVERNDNFALLARLFEEKGSRWQLLVNLLVKDIAQSMNTEVNPIESFFLPEKKLKTKALQLEYQYNGFFFLRLRNDTLGPCFYNCPTGLKP